jgi:hypothetical protein
MKFSLNLTRIANVEEMTENIALAAVSINVNAIMFIPDKYQTKKVLIETIKKIECDTYNEQFTDFLKNMDTDKFNDNVWKMTLLKDPRSVTLMPENFYTDEIYLALFTPLKF